MARVRVAPEAVHARVRPWVAGLSELALRDAPADPQGPSFSADPREATIAVVAVCGLTARAVRILGEGRHPARDWSKGQAKEYDEGAHGGVGPRRGPFLSSQWATRPSQAARTSPASPVR